jgi:hypothetical protein
MTDRKSTEDSFKMTDRKSIEDSSKLAIEDVDTTEELHEKSANRDYAGAAAKTDPAEIKLVRKLDYRILPTLFVMYFLNYVDSMFIRIPTRSCD